MSDGGSDGQEVRFWQFLNLMRVSSLYKYTLSGLTEVMVTYTPMSNFLQ